MAIIDNSDQFIRRLERNLDDAASHLVSVCCELVTDQLLIGYDDPVWMTGDLVRSVTGKAEKDGNGFEITIGDTMEYAPFVHDGTRKMKARPFLRDALLSSQGKEIIKSEAIAILTRGV